MRVEAYTFFFKSGRICKRVMVIDAFVLRHKVVTSEALVLQQSKPSNNYEVH